MRQRDRMYEATGIDGIVIVRERLKGITWGGVVCIIVYAQSQGRRSLLKKVKRATKLLRFVVCAVSLCTL